MRKLIITLFVLPIIPVFADTIQDNYICQSNNSDDYSIWIESADNGQYARLPYKVSSGQPWEGVYNIPKGTAKEHEGCIDIRSGRKKEDDATRWATLLQSQAVYGCNDPNICSYKIAVSTDGSRSNNSDPGKLNWAVSVVHGLWFKQGPHTYHCFGSQPSTIAGTDPQSADGTWPYVLILSQGSYYHDDRMDTINNGWLWSNFNHNLPENQSVSNSQYDLKCVTADANQSNPQITYMRLTAGRTNNSKDSEITEHMTFTPISAY